MDSLQEENDALLLKNKKWIGKLDDEIDKNAKLVSELTQKIKALSEEKYKLEFALTSNTARGDEEDLMEAEETIKEK